MPMMSPTMSMSRVGTKPVELAMALGGVEIGRVMGREVLTATKSSIDVTPPRTARLSPKAVPTKARMGISRLAAEVLEMKVEMA